jgi:hypothetical protein
VDFRIKNPALPESDGLDAIHVIEQARRVYNGGHLPE